MIDIEAVRLLAAQRAMDVLPFDQAVAIGSEIIAGRFDAIAVLVALEAVEQRRAPSVAASHWPARRVPTAASGYRALRLHRQRKRERDRTVV